MKHEPLDDDPPLHPLWDRKLALNLTPRKIIGILVTFAVLLFAGFGMQP